MGLEERRRTKEIDGVLYEVTPLMFSVGHKTLMRTIKVMSPILGAAYKETGTAMYAAIFEALPTSLSDEDVTYFATVFGNASRYQDGDKWVPLVPANQELHFAERYLTFLHWITFCMEVNFSSFFAGTMKGAGVADITNLMTQTAA